MTTAHTAQVSLYDLTRSEMSEHLNQGAKVPGYRVDQIWQGLYDEGLAISEITTLPAALRETLATDLPTALTTAEESVSKDGQTIKWLWKLNDGAAIETVLMHYRDRSTVCISTQAGCAMACGFCATGQAGFDRQLTVGEIVEQVVMARRASGDRRVSNVVFMGMGEPMANYGATWAAAERLHGDFGLSARHLTISTVGVIPGIRRLAEESLPVNLAVSLHAANDTLRDEMVPINKRYPISDLMSACHDYFDAKGRRVSFEWALIDGVNDRPSDAHELAALASPLRAHVNLIPLNPTPGYLTRGTPPDRVRSFADELTSLGVNATVRRNRGTDIDAACGQLRANSEAAAKPAASRVAAPVKR
ncbi:MAG: 23S rRNA (adenine(2503)-C(2))-methyltransferase RlmN [Acidimicrobiales bacterium]